MIIIEYKEAVFGRAFEELDEAKKSLKKTKLALCNVEDSLCDIYESVHDSEEEEEHDDYNDTPEENDTDIYTGDIEVNYRKRRNMRGMRRGSNMRYRTNRRHYGLYSY